MARKNVWPTPTAGDAKSSGSRNTANSKAHPGISLTDAVRNDGGTGRTEGGGPLNPTWVEWLMGWPLGWTDFEHLGTDKFRAWQHLLGACSPKVSSPPAAAGEPDVADPSGGGTKNSRDA
jgi:DNA (cytosine-5)-methyltransferase 1